jgi:corrinoid protein of di/trimethylamine methyltransferase
MRVSVEEKNRLLEEMQEALGKLQHDRVVELCKKAVDLELDAYECINEGLSKGMQIVSRKFDTREYFVPELLRAAKAMNAGIDILKPYIKVDPSEQTTKGKVVIGTVRADIHAIGKNLVALMMEAHGFEVHNLGVNIDAETFLKKAEEVGADIIGMSALMTTTMLYMRKVIDHLKAQGVRDKYIVMVGGAPISPEFARDIGADAYAPHAAAAVDKAKELLQAQRVATTP